MVRPIPEDADSVAVVGENRKMLVFPLAELPELGRGQGVTLQRYRDGGPVRRHRLPLERRLVLALGGESGRVRTETDLTSWRAARGAAGPHAADRISAEQPLRLRSPFIHAPDVHEFVALKGTMEREN